MATNPDTVEVVAGRLAEADRLDAEVAKLRQRFSRAIIDRYLACLPTAARGVFVAPGAALVGDVRLGADVSIWYGCVLRADIAPITVGDRADVQDGTVIHVADDGPCVIGAETVVGHRVMLHACRIGEGCLIGMQATVLDDAVIGHGSVVGAGAVVPPRAVIPPHSLVLGVPGKVIKTLRPEDEAFHRAIALKYTRLKENYRRDAHRGESG